MEGGRDGVRRSGTQPPSQTVIEAVASAEGVPPSELGPPEYEPLHAVVDPDALDTLFARRPDGTERAGGSVSFQYCGYEFTVDQQHTVTIDRALEE